MKKALIAILFLLSLTTYAQITKGNWMMGGSGSFGNYKSTTGNSIGDSTNISIAPQIGYFLIDKLAIGTSGSFTYIFPTGDTKIYTPYTLSPFLRYYYLKVEKDTNIFSEVSYEIMRFTTSFDYATNADKFKFKTGAVFFLTNSVGIEVALNYANQKTNKDYTNRAIYLDVGFQIHLEKK